MKTSYEIAWDLLKTSQRFYSKQVSEVIDFTLGVEEVADLSGVSPKIVRLFQKKQEILESLPDTQELSLVRQVIEEIEQGKPHWNQEALEACQNVKMTAQSRLHEQDEQGLSLHVQDLDADSAWKRLRLSFGTYAPIHKKGKQNESL